MAAILSIETATPLCSVALAVDGKVLAYRESQEEKSHAARLTVFIEEIMHEQGLHMKDLDAIAIGKGPGSYTGLRIGVSTAKGLCYGAKIPLIALGTLKILFNQAVAKLASETNSLNNSGNILLCPMIDARRMEVFTCMYSLAGEEMQPVSATIIEPVTFSGFLSDNRIFFFGSGMDKCRDILAHPNAHFVDDIKPRASALASSAEQLFKDKSFENLAYFEPFYLKEFIATIPKKRLTVQ
jgi:tRNA threonylcarbamoyladenosine biosynthesis protein TsaB